MTGSKKDTPAVSGQHGTDKAPPPAADAPQSRPHGYLSDKVPGLVPPSRRNQGDTGVASDQPSGGGELDFDDGSMWDRGNTARTGGTWAAQGADSAPLGPPAEVFSDSNQPSDQQNRPEGARSDGQPAGRQQQGATNGRKA